jgi:hypothetical protein
MFACCSAGAAGFTAAGGSAPGAGVVSFNSRAGVVVSQTNDYNTNQVQNLSGVAGATCTAALNQLDSDIAAVAADLAALSTSDIANASGVAGATCTAALNQLDSDIAAVAADLAALSTSDIANASGVAGATCTAALNQLDSDIAAVAAGIGALDSDDIANVSDVDGADVTEALNALGLGALKRGADLSGTANSSLEREDGCLWVMQPGVTTAPRTVLLETTGAKAPTFPFNFVLCIYPQAHAVTISNNGPAGAVAGATTITVAVGDGVLVYFQFDGVNYYLAGLGDLE